MQYYFSLLPQALEVIEKTLSPDRLARYLGAAKGDKNRAIRLYIWNADLSREFYLPIQLTEVALRNSIHNRLTALYGNSWFEARELLSAIPERTQVEVTKAAALERFQRGPGFTVDHVVAGLSFGFWLSLLNSSMTERLWSGNIRPFFLTCRLRCTSLTFTGDWKS
jgi:hypothetical protein